MRYIVIDMFGGNYNIVTNQEGETVVFTDLASAQEERDDCQEGIVVPLIDIISIVKSFRQALDDQEVICLYDIEPEINDILNLT